MNFFSLIAGKIANLFFQIRRTWIVAPRKAALVSSASFAAIGPIVFLGFNAASQLLHPTSNPIAVTVSFLVFGSYGWLQTVAFYILGISLIALSIALILKIKSRFHFGAIVVFLCGVAFLLVASNHVQNSGVTITLSEMIHRDSAISIVVMSPLACFALAPSLKANGHNGLWVYSIVAGCIAVATIIAGFLIPTAHNSYLGIFERILLLNGQLWGEIICLRLIWTTVKTKTPGITAKQEVMDPGL